MRIDIISQHCYNKKLKWVLNIVLAKKKKNTDTYTLIDNNTMTCYTGRLKTIHPIQIYSQLNSDESFLKHSVFMGALYNGTVLNYRIPTVNYWGK